MLATLANFTHRFRLLILLAGLAFVLAGVIYGTKVFDHLFQGGFDDTRSDSYQASRIITERLGQTDASLLVLFSSGDAKVTDPTYQSAVTVALSEVAADPSVRQVTTYYTSGEQSLVSKDQKSTYAVISLAGTEQEQQKAVERLRPQFRSDELQIQLGGPAAVNEEIKHQVESDLAKIETFSFPILALLLLVVFRGFVAASLPLLLGGFSILGAFVITRLLTGVMEVSQYAINIITVLGLGLAVDYSLFMVSRFREELRERLGKVEEALRRTMQTAGRTVFFSGLTVMVSLLSLLVFPLNFLQSMGVGGAAAVVVAMVGALIVLPALLALLGNRINALSFGRSRRTYRAIQAGAATRPAGGMAWSAISRFSMRWPLLVIVLTLVPLILAGLPFLRANFGLPDVRALPVNSEAREVSKTLERDFGRESSPTQVVLRAPSRAMEPANIAAVHEYASRLRTQPGVKRIVARYQQFYSQITVNSGTLKPKERYASGPYILLNVYYDGDSQSKQTQDLVKRIRQVPTPERFEAEVGGETAALVDLLAALREYIPYALAIIVGTLFILLMIMLRSLLIPFKAIVMNIVALSAAFGAQVWIFQDGRFTDLLGFTPVGSIDATQPILIFAIAFGLSMDYAAFLLSRIKEEYDRTGDNTQAVAAGVQKTGGIITSAALLLLVVIGSFATSSIPIMRQIGIGLGLALAIDAVIVRLFLVPATMRLLGRANWWPGGGKQPPGSDDARPPKPKDQDLVC